MRQALLPEDREGMTISLMTVGDVGYTVPWAMWVDKERRCWLHPDYTISARPGGTVTMRVERCRDGFVVIALPSSRWEPRSTPGYVSPADTEYLPVVSIR